MTKLPVKPVLTLEAAKEIAARAHAEAAKLGCKMAIAIVDDGANLIYLERMTGTQIGSVRVAQDKAETAARFKRPTKLLEDAVLAGRTVLLTLNGMTPIEGGVPILVENEIVGAIGVSGGTSTQDGQVATAGASC